MVKHVLNLKGDPRRQAKMNGIDNSAVGFVRGKCSSHLLLVLVLNGFTYNLDFCMCQLVFPVIIS